MANHIVTTDDDPAIRKVLQLFLQREGHHVTPCTDGNDLERVLKRQADSVDLVLLDIKMPGPSGFEMLEKIQHHYPFVPVVMLTAFNDLDTGMRAIRAGASDFLTKPVSRQTLLSCVQRVIRKSRERQRELATALQTSETTQELQIKLESALSALKNTTRTTLEAFSETIEQKDSYTKGHCSRVRSIAVALARELRLPQDRILIIEGGSLLHDIGKIGISEEILNKKGALTDDEYAVIKMHPVSGERIIGHIELFQQYRPIIRSHHERIDGRGYPDGLSGSEIPLDVRIVSIADAYDAMTSNRAYRDALPREIAVEEMKLCSGKQFDSDLVKIFIDKELYLL